MIECLTDDVSIVHLGDGGEISELFLNHMDPLTGVKWILVDIEGWWTLPEVEIPDVPRGWDDGSYETAGRYTARNLTLSGHILPTSKSQIPAARQELMRFIDLCRKNAWIVARETGRTVGCSVRLSGQPLVSSTKLDGRVDFSVGLRAPDPVKYALNGGYPPGWYSETQVGAGTRVITNLGDYQVSPIITITGPTTGRVKVTNNTLGQSLDVQRILLPGEDLVVDVKNRSVTLDGERNQRRYLRWDTDWPYLLPGGNEWVFGPYSTEDGTPAAANGAQVTFEWRHGWMA